ncbi:MAG: hypothetical protein D6710_10795 [Nitrospirae bacterium]|nr:MAG: hypothetical protein D6710_10795 [Nitrospirota bacterium]
MVGKGYQLLDDKTQYGIIIGMEKGGVTMRAAVFSLILMLILSLSAYAAEKSRLVICGTGDSQSILREVAPMFEKLHPDVDVDVPDSIGSSGGIRMTAQGRCDLGRVARPIKKKEEKYNLKYQVFAYSPVVFAANLDGRASIELTTEEILDIFKGRVKTWKPFTGIDAPIYVANREPGDSSRRVLEKTLPGWKNIEHFEGKTIYSTPELVDILLQNPYTIGYGPYAMLGKKGLSIVAIDGYLPTIENIQRGDYRPVTPFGIVWKGRLEGRKRDFVEFLFSPQVKELFLKRGLIPAKR